MGRPELLLGSPSSLQRWYSRSTPITQAEQICVASANFSLYDFILFSKEWGSSQGNKKPIYLLPLVLY